MSANVKTGFGQTMMEIAFMGAFYGLTAQAEAIFSYYHSEKIAPEAAGLGLAFTALAAHDYPRAINLLETMDGKSAEAKCFLLYAYRQSKKNAGRASQLAQELAASGNPAVVKTAAALA